MNDSLSKQSYSMVLFGLFQTGPRSDAIDKLQSELLDVISSTKGFETVQFHPIEDLHISVTRTVVLRHHWIDEFIRSIENSLKNAHK